MSYYADLEEKRKKANKIGIALRINSEQRMKLNDIREYLKTNLGEIPKGFYYKWKSENLNDGEIIRFLIENFEIPEDLPEAPTIDYLEDPIEDVLDDFDSGILKTRNK